MVKIFNHILTFAHLSLKSSLHMCIHSHSQAQLVIPIFMANATLFARSASSSVTIFQSPSDGTSDEGLVSHHYSCELSLPPVVRCPLEIKLYLKTRVGRS